MVSMVARIDISTAQIIELLAECHHSPKREDKCSENFANPFFRYQHRTKSIDDRR